VPTSRSTNPEQGSDSDLTVDGILRQRPRTRELVVKTVGPAACYVLEADAPPRLVHNATSESERLALLHHLNTDRRAGFFNSAWSWARTDADGFEDTGSVERSQAHGERLSG
jgi:hypothetical protein